MRYLTRDLASGHLVRTNVMLAAVSLGSHKRYEVFDRHPETVFLSMGMFRTENLEACYLLSPEGDVVRTMFSANPAHLIFEDLNLEGDREP